MARSSAREAAMQLIFEHIFGGDGDENTLGAMIEYTPNARDDAYITRVTQGVYDHQTQIDARISEFLQDWTLERLARVDLSILRLAVYELLYCQDIPGAVTINEAVELARKFSTPESGSFINGVLGNLNRSLVREQ